ncbi:MAG: arginine--tRNA ligase [Candidatus Woesearchaeota archaeon]
MDFRKELSKILAKETKLPEKEVSQLLAVPPDSRLGDYAFPCFKLGKNAKEEADKLKQKIKLPKFLSKTEVAGPYLNFYLNNSILAQDTLTKIYQEKKDYGKQDQGKDKKIVIDFSSPNIAKPFGIGHLRSTVIGNCLYKIFHALGYQPLGVNHLGDWGTQFGKLIVAYKKWGKKIQLEKDPVKYLLELYVRFHQEAEKDIKLEEEARQWFKRLEDGDKEATALWEDFRELSLEEFKRIYRLLEVEFDSYHGEAFYNNLLDKTVKEIQKQIKTEISEGALIVNLKQYKLPPLMLRKSDQATTYATRDLAAVLYRLKQYQPEKIVYVVGSEQKLHFQQLFTTLNLLGHSDQFVHVDFGLFQFPEGKMSTRKGNIIFLEEVLDKAIKLAEQIIEEKNPDLKNKQEIARQVGIGAIIFADLSNDRIRNITFDWKKFLSFEGETGPYLQYTHARSCSILRKAKTEHNLSISAKVNFETFDQEEELGVVKLLYQFPEIISKVGASYKPHHLANYLIALAQAFNEFYHKCPVISEQKQVMKARLLLVDCVRQTLDNGLQLLGIKAPEEM